MAPRWNVLMVVLDDLPADGMSKMPLLDAKLAAMGNRLTFTKSFCQVPVCNATRAAVLCGRYGRNSGATNNSNGLAWHDSTVAKALPMALRRAGFQTAHFGKYVSPGYPYYSAAYVPPGWEKFWADISGQYLGYDQIEQVGGVGVRTTAGSADADYQPDVVHSRANTWLSTVREPFFGQLSYFAPHQNGLGLAPIPATRHAGLHAATAIVRSPSYLEAMADKPAWMQAAWPAPSAQAQADMDAAHRKAWEAQQAVDESLNTLLTVLTTRGLQDRTLVIILADNTRLMYEHNIDGKTVAFDEACDTHLTMRWPGQAARNIGGLVSSVDIAPTIADVAGARLLISPDGMSLRTLVEGTAPWRTALFSEWGGGSTPSPVWSSIRTATEKWTEYADGSRERYDLAADPYELVNLAGQDAVADAALVSQLSLLAQGA